VTQCLGGSKGFPHIYLVTSASGLIYGIQIEKKAVHKKAAIDPD
jgi:hypothetical protein